jgi:uncharacterized protein (DUF4415 family)
MVFYTSDIIPPPDKAQLEKLRSIPDEAIDYSDIPPLTDGEGKEMRPSHFFHPEMYRPVKTDIHVRLDTDIIAWLKSAGKGYQTRMNAILRDAMLRSL